MTSNQITPIPTTASEQSTHLNEDMASPPSPSFAHELAAQAQVPRSAWRPGGSDPIIEAEQSQARLSASSLCFEPGNHISVLPHNIVSVANTRQTHHLDLQPTVGSYVRPPEVIQAAAQAQRLDTALAAVSIFRNGRRYLKPWLVNTVPIRFVEMLSQKQLESSISSSEQRAAMLLSRYNKQRAVIDMLDGLTPQQSNDRTRESLLQKIRETVASLKRRIPILSFDDFEVARDEAEQKREVWFALMLVRMIGLCLEVQYIYLDDTSKKEYWFQDNSYKKRCCELEAWKVALYVLSRATNEEVQRLDRRVDQYMSG